MAYQQPKLPYAFDALEPHIDARTMEIHYGKHHAAYVANYNAAMEKHPELAGRDLTSMLRDLSAVPEDIRTAVRNSGGGAWNHSLFWEVMSPKGGAPAGELVRAIDRYLGGIDKMKEAFAKAAMARFGSGWAWLTVQPGGTLCICSSPNQDSPLMKGVSDCPGHILMGLDVWEHAYYLTYQNRRADYIAAWWNVVNWERISALYAPLAK